MAYMRAKKIKKRRISVQVQPQEFKDIEKVCKEEGITKQKLIHSLIYQFLYMDE